MKRLKIMQKVSLDLSSLDLSSLDLNNLDLSRLLRAAFELYFNCSHAWNCLLPEISSIVLLPTFLVLSPSFF